MADGDLGTGVGTDPRIGAGTDSRTERQSLWLNDIPPGVSEQRYRQILIIVLPINAVSEYMHLSPGWHGANRHRQRDVMGGLTAIMRI